MFSLSNQNYIYVIFHLGADGSASWSSSTQILRWRCVLHLADGAENEAGSCHFPLLWIPAAGPAAHSIVFNIYFWLEHTLFT